MAPRSAAPASSDVIDRPQGEPRKTRTQQTRDASPHAHAIFLSQGNLISFAGANNLHFREHIATTVQGTTVRHFCYLRTFQKIYRQDNSDCRLL